MASLAILTRSDTVQPLFTSLFYIFRVASVCPLLHISSTISLSLSRIKQVNRNDIARNFTKSLHRGQFL
jgi:hypothetical protein